MSKHTPIRCSQGAIRLRAARKRRMRSRNSRADRREAHVPSREGSSCQVHKRSRTTLSELLISSAMAVMSRRRNNGWFPLISGVGRISSLAQPPRGGRTETRLETPVLSPSTAAAGVLCGRPPSRDMSWPNLQSWRPDRSRKRRPVVRRERRPRGGRDKTGFRDESPFYRRGEARQGTDAPENRNQRENRHYCDGEHDLHRGYLSSSSLSVVRLVSVLDNCASPRRNVPHSRRSAPSFLSSHSTLSRRTGRLSPTLT